MNLRHTLSQLDKRMEDSPRDYPSNGCWGAPEGSPPLAEENYRLWG